MERVKSQIVWRLQSSGCSEKTSESLTQVRVSLPTQSRTVFKPPSLNVERGVCTCVCIMFYNVPKHGFHSLDDLQDSKAHWLRKGTHVFSSACFLK